MKRFRWAIALFPIALVFASAALAQDRQLGRWSKDGRFVQLNIACSQLWVCGPSKDILTDKRILSTSPRSTQGSCSAGDGPIGGCNACMASEPRDRCEWWLDSK